MKKAVSWKNGLHPVDLEPKRPVSCTQCIADLHLAVTEDCHRDDEGDVLVRSTLVISEAAAEVTGVVGVDRYVRASNRCIVGIGHRTAAAAAAAAAAQACMEPLARHRTVGGELHNQRGARAARRLWQCGAMEPGNSGIISRGTVVDVDLTTPRSL